MSELSEDYKAKADLTAEFWAPLKERKLIEQDAPVPA
jgi:hypothetical protein